MADSDAQRLIERQSQLESNRVNFENWWQSIAERVLPSNAVITTDSEPGGQRRTERLFDSRPATACQRFGAIVEDLVTPRTMIWNTLAAPDALKDDQDVKIALDEINSRLYSMRYRPKANFSENRALAYVALGAFGNYSIFIHDKPGEGACYEFVHPRETYWAANRYGNIDVWHRKHKLELRVAAERFGEKNLPEKLRTALTKNPFEKHWFLQVIGSNETREHGRRDYRGWEWSSTYLAIEDKTILERSGYPVWPISIGRYTLAPGEVYARSPAMECWPAILTLNEQKKTVLRAGQKEVDPPMLLSDDGALDPFSMRSSAINYGYVNDQGQPLALPLKTGSNIPLGIELMQIEASAIDDSFLTAIFKILSDNPEMTATQVLEIARQRAVLLAPTMGRLHSEDLGQQIAREIQILDANGMLPEIPQQLAEAADQYKIEYQSPLARAMRAADGQAILQTVTDLPSFISADPNTAYVFDVPEMARELADIRGVPAKLVRDKRAVAALAQQAAESEQAQQAVAAAPDLSTATLNAAKAEQLRSGVAA